MEWVRMLFCESTEIPCGKDRMRRSSGSVTLRAASTGAGCPRGQYPRAIPSVMPPRLLSRDVAFPRRDNGALQRARGNASASSIARRIRSCRRARLAISPCAGLSIPPRHGNEFRAPESSTSLSRAHVFVLPTSAPPIFILLVKPPLFNSSLGPAGERAETESLKTFYPRSHGLRPQWSAL